MKDYLFKFIDESGCKMGILETGVSNITEAKLRVSEVYDHIDWKDLFDITVKSSGYNWSSYEW